MSIKLHKFVFMFILILSCCENSWAYKYSGPEQFWGEDVSGSSIDNVEHLKSLGCYDFSNIWMQHQDKIIGYIGSDYQRFYIHLDKIQKSKTSENLYLVSGKTKVKNNVNDFTGEIKILHIYGMSQAIKSLKLQELKQASEAGDTDIYKRYKRDRFVIIAQYSFRENSKQIGSGVFQGEAQTYFYFEKNKIFYDDLNLKWSDNYANNLFVGTWQNYKTGVVKKCDFGNFRIPDSGDLDIGTGEFSPNEKYFDSGWKVYSDAYIKQDKKARKEEKKPWWL